MIRLVVNAEGFGTGAEGDTRAIEAHDQGIVTSVSLLGNALDLTRAAAALRAAPELGVGLSLALTDGFPVAEAARVPSLCDVNQRLRASAADLALAWATGAIAALDIERELEAQIARARDAGLVLDHLSTAHDVGFLPGVGTIVERLAHRFSIPGVRASVEPPNLAWLASPRRGARTALLAGMAWLTRRQMGPLRHGPLTWGYVESGRLDEVRILEIIGRLGPGAHELLCHPGGPGGDREANALASEKIKTAIDERGIVLCRWRDLF